MTDPDLVRLVDAQASVNEEVVEQLTEGHKQTIECGSSFRNLLA
jgi:uncharacterized protein (DUF1810 family)